LLEGSLSLRVLAYLPVDGGDSNEGPGLSGLRRAAD